MNLEKKDKLIYDFIELESKRQREHIELIASENYVSEAVLEAQGSILTNKYAEGYPARRYYGGCEYVDMVENEAIDRLKKMFSVKHANVQPHSGSQANMAAYQALIKPGDLILGMSLNEGGHLTHGYHLNFSGNFYRSVFYSVDRKTELIDYDAVRKIALEHKPKLIIAGASAYSRIIDFKKFREIADEIGAYLVADIAHIAGLVVAGVHPSPFPYVHVATSTTHKTLRGPRGGIILTNDDEIAKNVNRAVFPGVQGGPLMHVIAAKAVAFGEALKPEFKKYQEQVVKNSKLMAKTLQDLGYPIVSGGTDNHLFMVNVKKKYGVTGIDAENTLHRVNITCNKNGVPFDEERPAYASGIRIGTAAITTLGYTEAEVIQIAHLIDQTLQNKNDDEKIKLIKQEVLNLTKTVEERRKGEQK